MFSCVYVWAGICVCFHTHTHTHTGIEFTACKYQDISTLLSFHCVHVCVFLMRSHRRSRVYYTELLNVFVVDPIYLQVYPNWITATSLPVHFGFFPHLFLQPCKKRIVSGFIQYISDILHNSTARKTILFFVRLWCDVLGDIMHRYINRGIIRRQQPFTVSVPVKRQRAPAVAASVAPTTSYAWVKSIHTLFNRPLT